MPTKQPSNSRHAVAAESVAPRVVDRAAAARRRARRKRFAGGLTWLRAVLFGHFRLKRGGRGVRIAFAETVFQPSVAPTAQDSEGAKAQGTPIGEDERAMYAALAAALDSRRNLRMALRQLAYVEGRLQRQGLASLASVPADVLERAFRQLTMLAAGAHAAALAPLEASLSEVLTTLGVRDHLLDAGSPHDFLARAKPVVSEGRLSDFLRLSDEVESTD